MSVSARWHGGANLKIATYWSVVIGIDRRAVIVTLHPHVTCWHFTPPCQVIAINGDFIAIYSGIIIVGAILHHLQQFVVLFAMYVRMHTNSQRDSGIIDSNYALDQLTPLMRRRFEADDIARLNFIRHVPPAINQHQI